MDVSTLKTIRCELADGLARIVLAQPARGNPIDGAFCRELSLLAAALGVDPGLRAVLITAEGPNFSVGGDIKSFLADRAAVPGIIAAWTADLHAAIARLVRMRAPVVVAVQGNVAGGSVSLAAAADLLFAADNARFTAAFPAIGFSADSGSTMTLTARMGFSRAKRFLMMAESLRAAEAEAAGLVDVVTAPDALAGTAEAAALRFAAGPTLAYGGIKDLMRRARFQPLEAQMEDEAQTLAAIAASEDAWEGLTAFGEKRKPAFKGR